MSDYAQWFLQVFLLTFGLLILGTLLYLFLRLLRRRAGISCRLIRPLPALFTFALAGDVLMTLILTFFERSYTISALQLVPFTGLIERHYTLFFLNIAVFVPFGALVALCFPRLRRVGIVTAISFGFSLLIELLQLIFRRGVCDIDDLICNTLGGLIGAALICALRRIFMTTSRR